MFFQQTIKVKGPWKKMEPAVFGMGTTKVIRQVKSEHGWGFAGVCLLQSHLTTSADGDSDKLSPAPTPSPL